MRYICVALFFAATVQVFGNRTHLPSPRNLREPVFPQTGGFATLFEADVQRTQSCGNLCVVFLCFHKVCHMFSIPQTILLPGLPIDS